MGYVHHWLSIRCSSFSFSSSSSFRPDPFWTSSDQLRFTHWWAQSFRLVEYIKTLQGRWGTCIIDTHFAALSLLLLFLLIKSWPHSNISRSTVIDSLVGSIDLCSRVHHHTARTLGYIYNWLAICCSTLPLCLSHCLPLQIWPFLNCGRSTLIGLLVGSINLSRRGH